MKTQISDSLKRNLALLREVADRLKVQTKPFNLHDPQVARSPFDWHEAQQYNTVLPPDRFSRKLQCVIDGNRTLIRVNDEYVVIEMNGAFGGNIVCSFNHKNVFFQKEHFGTARLASATLASLYGCRIFLLKSEASSNAPSLLRKPAIRKYIRALNPGPKESLHILQGQVALYLQRYKSGEVLDALKRLSMLVCNLRDASKQAIGFEALPAEFHGLIPLIQRWGITDDEERSERLVRASRSVRSLLVKEVEPYFNVINRYLDSFGSKPLPEHAVLLGALAECVSEALISLNR
jgi:hypothetical protein